MFIFLEACGFDCETDNYYYLSDWNSDVKQFALISKKYSN